MAIHSPLVSTDWLDQGIAAGAVVLDTSVFLDPPTAAGAGAFRSGHQAFLDEGHIPGARFADLFLAFSDADSPLPFTRPTQAQFELAAGRLGITPQTHVIVYDRLVGQWASRLWWVFRSFGHARVSVLDGGLKRYLAEGRALEFGDAATLMPAHYDAQKTMQFVAAKQDVLDIVEHKTDGALVCLLQAPDFEGAISVRRRAGHIPGSVNVPFNRLLDQATNRLKSTAELKAIFAEATGLDGRRIITYCGGGIASTLGALALASIGYDNTAEYDGSLAEWVADDDLPMELGPTAG